MGLIFRHSVGNTTYHPMRVASKDEIFNQDEDTMSSHKFLVHQDGDYVGVAVQDIKAGEEVLGVETESGKESTGSVLMRIVAILSLFFYFY